jgi:hypothetical protein
MIASFYPSELCRLSRLALLVAAGGADATEESRRAVAATA